MKKLTITLLALLSAAVINGADCVNDDDDCLPVLTGKLVFGVVNAGTSVASISGDVTIVSTKPSTVISRDDYGYSIQPEHTRKAFANPKNYSVVRRDGKYRVIVWDGDGKPWDSSRAMTTNEDEPQRLFNSQYEARKYVHEMHSYYKKRLDQWTVVWGKPMEK